MEKEKEAFSPLREKLHEVIFEADTVEGKIFDVFLLVTILASVVVVALETVPSLNDRYHNLFYNLEWIFTVFFTIEYLLRLYSVRKPVKYATSFFGIVDLISTLPTYLAIFFAGTQSLMIVRALRLLRVFRVFKLANFLREGQVIVQALKASRPKIGIFVLFILISVSIFGSIMYLVEGGINEQFDSIPRSIYWAIVTITTVGYGDIAPLTPFGQFLSSVIMILGYAVIAVPTGIVSSEIVKTQKKQLSTQACRYCAKEGHEADAIHCKYCGEKLNF